MPASLLFGGDRRMEAETYLLSGFGIRAAIESKPDGWLRLGDIANVWMPGRLKGIQVGRDSGTPFLTATQAYDFRPMPRKWLALAKTSDATNRFVSTGMILVTCSGTVGRPTVAYLPHEHKLISHDLLRVEPIDPDAAGWLYACLHAPQVRAMLVSAKYGHMIKHLEVPHLRAIPVPKVSKAESQRFTEVFGRIIELRNEGYRLTLEAEQRFESGLGGIPVVSDWGEQGFSLKAAAFLSNRRRFEAAAHTPAVATIRAHLKKHGAGFTTIAGAGYEVWLPSRFRRIPATAGVQLRDSAQLLEVNPDITKRIADGPFGDPYGARVKPGWILMARSGQTYGIIGTPIIAGEDLLGDVISDHVLRIKPGPKASIAAGYLVTALGHPILGRPLVKALAYGSSIPELDPSDIAEFEVVRMSESDETAIAELAERSARARAAADVLEREMSEEASRIIASFMAR